MCGSITPMMHDRKTAALWLGVGALLALALFYLTPLKHVALIEPRINDIESAEFYKEYSENPDKYLFIDVRPPENYNRAHAKGSINVPLHMLYDERVNLPKSGKEIVLICSGGRASGVGYMYLEHYGFLNLKRIEGGIEAWQAAGMPVEVSLN